MLPILTIRVTLFIVANYTVTDPHGNNHQVSAPDGSDDGSILGFVYNMINQAGSAIQGQWDKGAPYRVALGALLSGDTGTAKQVINDNFGNTTPEDIGNAAINAGIGFAAPIKNVAKAASDLGFNVAGYHGTANDISEFTPKQSGATFISPDAETANGFASRSQWWKNSHGVDNGSGPNVMPVLVRGKNIFDYENPAHMQSMQDSFSASGQDISNSVDAIGRGDWRAIESPDIQSYIKKNYDGFHINEEGVKNIGIYDPANIRSRFAAFNPNIQNSANILAGAGAGTVAIGSLLDQGNNNAEQ